MTASKGNLFGCSITLILINRFVGVIRDIVSLFSD